jgi:hypothetical protein
LFLLPPLVDLSEPSNAALFGLPPPLFGEGEKLLSYGALMRFSGICLGSYFFGYILSFCTSSVRSGDLSFVGTRFFLGEGFITAIGTWENLGKRWKDSYSLAFSTLMKRTFAKGSSSND